MSFWFQLKDDKLKMYLILLDLKKQTFAGRKERRKKNKARNDNVLTLTTEFLEHLRNY